MSWYPVSVFPDEPSYGGGTAMTAVTATWFGYEAVGYGPAGGRTWWSSDGGLTWNEPPYPDPALAGAQVLAVAASPSLLVAAGNGRGTVNTAPELWTSRDGVTWTAIDLGAEAGNGYMTGVTWTGTEFVAVGRGASDATNAKAWRSSDGRSWTAADLGDADPYGVVSGPAGTFAWGTVFEGPSAMTAWSFTPGSAPARFEIDQVLNNVVATSDGFVGLVPAAPSGYDVFRSADAHSWQKVGSLEESMTAGFTVRPDGALVAAGMTADQVPVVFESRDGSLWMKDTWPAPPEAFADIASVVATPDGVIGVGSTAGNRVGVWLAVATGSDAPMAIQRDPEFTGCPTASTLASPTLLLADLFRLSRDRRLACLGDTPLHLRGYLVQSDGLGGTCGSTATPTWLAGGCLGYPVAWLQSIAVPFGSATSLEVFARSSLAAALQPGHWVDMTGHFDDPASTTCRNVDAAGQLVEPAKTTIGTCRRHFVATSVRWITAPPALTASLDPARILGTLPATYGLAPATGGWDNLSLPAATTWGFRDVTSPAGYRVLVTVFQASSAGDVPAISAALRQSHGPMTVQSVDGVAVAFSGGGEGSVFAIGKLVFDVTIDEEAGGQGVSDVTAAIIAATR